MIKSKYPGKFIVIEGLDGSGKSSQTKLLADYFTEHQKKVIVTKEPTMDSEAGRKVREFLQGKISLSPLDAQQLYVEDRKEHLENKIIPALQKGEYIISDRYAFSTFAYGSAEGLDINVLFEMNKNFLLPSLTFIVDVTPEQCVERIKKRKESTEYFEKLDKLKKINEFYKKMPKLFENVSVVNGNQTIENVSRDIKKVVNNLWSL